MTPEARGALAVLAAGFALLYVGSVVSTHLTGVPDSGYTTSTGTVRDGEGPPVPVATSSPVSPRVTRSPMPRVTPTKASRSRQDRRSPAGTGSLTDVTCYTWTGNRTASGKWPQVGMAASNRYPFGTRLHVEGVGVVTVEDRIGWGSDLDLYGPSESYCRQFGRRLLRVEVAR